MIKRRKIDKVIASNIQKIVANRGLSVSSLAVSVNMSRQLLEHKLREGRFYYSDVQEIANALGIQVGELTL